MAAMQHTGQTVNTDHHGPHEDWNSEEYVAYWLQREQERAAERRRQFTIVRAVVPKMREAEFRYLNLGAGPGNLDEVLLEQFPGATATLVDFSLLMLSTARQRLARFGDRVEYVQANLVGPDWVGATGGTFDFVFSTLTIHGLREPRRIRDLYTETYSLLGHGGMFLNFDYVRAARPTFARFAPWAAKDPEAGFSGRTGGEGLPGTLLEQLGWLAEAGFANIDVLWKDMNLALICGVRDHLHLPDGEHAHGAQSGHQGEGARPAADGAQAHAH